MKKIIKILSPVVMIAIFSFVLYYLLLPAATIHSAGTAVFILFILVIVLMTSVTVEMIRKASRTGNVIKNGKVSAIKSAGGSKISVSSISALAFLFVIIILIGGLISSAKIFSAKAYQSLLTVNEGDFLKDVQSISYDMIPALDKDSSAKLGERKMGEMSDLVSQFEVTDMYTQINYKGRPVRVTPLRYGGFFKWLNNKKVGISAYIMVDMVSQEVTCVRLNEGIKYSPSEFFSRDLKRYIRFKYPDMIFDEPVFEIDENGAPFWIISHVKTSIGLYGGKDIAGAVILNAVTGETSYYNIEEIPTWVDRVYNSERIINQYNDYGSLTHGFWNSIVGQRDVKNTTEGYNYIVLNDDVYMYTGITSVGKDESNIGFILVNQRTKETKFYNISGAEEYSGMASAEGLVQQFGYKATFPLLLNIDNQPTYFMALKDEAGLVKQYAMVNINQYQIGAIGDTIAECEKAYISAISKNGAVVGNRNNETEVVKGAIAEIRTTVIDGNSYYFIVLSNSDKVFVISSEKDRNVVMLNTKDNVEITYNTSDSSIIDAIEILKK